MELCMMMPSAFLDGVLLCGVLALVVWTAIASVHVAFLSMDRKSLEEELTALHQELTLHEERERLRQKYEPRRAEEERI